MTGIITGITATMATVDERVALCEIVDDVTGLLIGDKGYISKRVQEDLLQYHTIDLQTPLRSNMLETRHPAFVQQLMTTRRLVETVIGQLTDHLHIAGYNGIC